MLDLAYGRDLRSRVTSANLLNTSPSISQTFGYDAAGHLASVTRPATPSLPPNPALPLVTSYGFDAGDNLTSISRPTGVTSVTYDAAHQLQTATESSAGAVTTYSYDALGARSKEVRSLAGGSVATNYHFDQAQRFVGFEATRLPAGFLQYEYDGDGLLAFLQRWDLAEGMPLMIADGASDYITGPDGLPVEQIHAITAETSAPLFYHSDHLGSTRALTDKDGHVVVNYAYDAYGKATPSTPGVVNPFLFAGQYTDDLTGFVYLRTRWYDPNTAQFLSRDPIEPLTRSPYGYVQGDPINRTDPTGLAARPVLVSQGGAGVSGVCAGFDLVTPWGGIVVNGCLVAADGQVGFTETVALGSEVRGLSAEAGLSAFVSDACRIEDLKGEFASVSFAPGIEPVGVSYQEGPSSKDYVHVYGVSVGLGGGAWGGTTDTEAQVLGAGKDCGCG